MWGWGAAAAMCHMGALSERNVQLQVWGPSGNLWLAGICLSSPGFKYIESFGGFLTRSMNTIASVWITQSFKKLFLFWLFYLYISLFLILHFYWNYKSIAIERKKTIAGPWTPTLCGVWKYDVCGYFKCILKCCSILRECLGICHNRYYILRIEVTLLRNDKLIFREYKFLTQFYNLL